MVEKITRDNFDLIIYKTSPNKQGVFPKVIPFFYLILDITLSVFPSH